MLKEKLKIILKYFIVFVLGGIIAVAYLFIFSIKGLLEKIGLEAGLGIIALAPVLIIVYGIFYFLIGGICGIILLVVFRMLRKRRLNNHLFKE
jgi:hypothetical protein